MQNALDFASIQSDWRAFCFQNPRSYLKELLFWSHCPVIPNGRPVTLGRKTVIIRDFWPFILNSITNAPGFATRQSERRALCAWSSRCYFKGLLFWSHYPVIPNGCPVTLGRKTVIIRDFWPFILNSITNAPGFATRQSERRALCAWSSRCYFKGLLFWSHYPVIPNGRPVTLGRKTVIIRDFWPFILNSFT